ncbi:MAG: hypothetical protein LBM02_02530 [Lachnospiraceae bacterium]|jgi:hypothetical protein|nr:hypothetical protein [Lachnospiraceae bacterium]
MRVNKNLIKLMLLLGFFIASFFLISIKAHAAISIDSSGTYHVESGIELKTLICNTPTQYWTNTNTPPKDLNIILDRDINIGARTDIYEKIRNVTVDCNEKLVYTTASNLDTGSFIHSIYRNNADNVYTIKNLTLKSTSTTAQYPAGTYYNENGNTTTDRPYFAGAYGFIFCGDYGQAASVTSRNGTLVWDNVNIDYSSVKTAPSSIQCIAQWTMDTVFRGSNSMITGYSDQSVLEICDIIVESGASLTIDVNNVGESVSAIKIWYDNLNNDTFKIENHGTLYMFDHTSSYMFGYEGTTVAYDIENYGNMMIYRDAVGYSMFEAPAPNITVNNYADAHMEFYDQAILFNTTGNFEANLYDGSTTYFGTGSTVYPPVSVAAAAGSNHVINIGNAAQVIYYMGKGSTVAPLAYVKVNYSGERDFQLFNDGALTNFTDFEDLSPIENALANTIFESPSITSNVVTDKDGVQTNIGNLSFRAFSLAKFKFSFTDLTTLPSFYGIVQLDSLDPYNYNYIPARNNNDPAVFEITDPKGRTSPKSVTMKIDNYIAGGTKLVMKTPSGEQEIETAETKILSSSDDSVFSVDGSGAKLKYILAQDNTNKKSGFFYKGKLGDFLDGTHNNVIEFTLKDEI